MEMKDAQRRETMACGLNEVKLAGDDGAMTFTGYGAVFGNVDSHGDVITPGAFADTLAATRKNGLWPAMLMQHGAMGLNAQDMTPIGIWTDLAEDGKGLWVEGKLADTPRGHEAYALLKMQPRPAISGLSIGYQAKEWSERTKPGEPRRTLKKIDLIEVSLVTFPSNPKARMATVKSEADLTAAERRDLEERLRDEGLSHKHTAIAVAIFRKWLLRDAGEPNNGPRDEGASAELVASLKRAASLMQPRH